MKKTAFLFFPFFVLVFSFSLFEKIGNIHRFDLDSQTNLVNDSDPSSIFSENPIHSSIDFFIDTDDDDDAIGKSSHYLHKTIFANNHSPYSKKFGGESITDFSPVSLKSDLPPFLVLQVIRI